MPPTKYKQLARHNSVCNEVYYKLQDCVAEHPVARFIGECTKFNTELDRCIQANWKQMVKKSSEKASLKRKKQMENTGS